MAYEINNNGQPKKSNKKKWLWILGLGILTAGVSVFGYRYFKRNKQTSNNDSSAPDFKAEKPKTAVKPKAPAKNPTAAKPGAPPKSKPAPKQATKTTASKQPVNAKQIGTDLHAAAVQKDFTKVYSQLRKIKNTSDYAAVNKVFSSLVLRGVRQTIITGILGTFTDPKQKETIRKSFTAMGLKYSDKTKKWSLSGVEETTIITTASTKVWKDPQTAVPVPMNMVLGQQVCQRGSFTLFENDKQYFLVETKHVKAYAA